MRRTAFVWLIALPLSVVGSQLAHELAYIVLLALGGGAVVWLRRRRERSPAADTSR